MRNKNTSLALNLLLIAIGMLALAYASVPLYRLFCQVTGYGGTTQEGAYRNVKATTREMIVTFNADHDPTLPWEFRPAERSMKIKVGEQSLTHFIAHNNSNEPITGRAIYNVVPYGVGSYFVKVECFCFTEQTLAPGQRVNMPVVFYIDPAILNDPDMKNVQTITLSYTFFPVKTETTPKP